MPHTPLTHSAVSVFAALVLTAIAVACDSSTAPDTNRSSFRRPSLSESGSRMLGYEPWWYHDPDCPGNPDAMDVYIVWGYETGGGQYAVTSSVYTGQFAYYCAGQYRGGDATTSYWWGQCADSLGQYHGNSCPCAGNTIPGGVCDVKGTR